MTICTISDRTTERLPADIWLTRVDAAEYLRVSPKTLANRRHEGPPYARFFGRAAYRLADLQAWSRQQQVRL